MCRNARSRDQGRQGRMGSGVRKERREGEVREFVDSEDDKCTGREVRTTEGQATRTEECYSVWTKREEGRAGARS